MRKNIVTTALLSIFASASLGGYAMPNHTNNKKVKKKATYFGEKTKRTKGKRERSLKSRANRMKAKRRK